MHWGGASGSTCLGGLWRSDCIFSSWGCACKVVASVIGWWMFAQDRLGAMCLSRRRLFAPNAELGRNGDSSRRDECLSGQPGRTGDSSRRDECLSGQLGRNGDSSRRDECLGRNGDTPRRDECLSDQRMKNRDSFRLPPGRMPQGLARERGWGLRPRPGRMSQRSAKDGWIFDPPGRMPQGLVRAEWGFAPPGRMPLAGRMPKLQKRAFGAPPRSRGEHLKRLFCPRSGTEPISDSGQSLPKIWDVFLPRIWDRLCLALGQTVSRSVTDFVPDLGRTLSKM